MKINKLIIDSTNSITDLCKLGVKFPTDKSPYNTQNTITPNGSGHRHPYTSVYNFLFSSLRYDKINLAEIGVLDNMSMLCWRSYFEEANLFGFDFNESFLDEGKNLNLNKTNYEFIDVKSIESIENTLGKYDKFDIIIEDSTHIFEDQIRVCGVAHKYLNPGGILIVEDIFRNESEQKYMDELSKISKYYSSATFIITEHELRYSPGWDNDKLLILHRNNN